VQINSTVKPILYFSYLVEPDQSNTVYHFFMINQTLCIVTTVYVFRNSYHG